MLRILFSDMGVHVCMGINIQWIFHFFFFKPKLSNISRNCWMTVENGWLRTNISKSTKGLQQKMFSCKKSEKKSVDWSRVAVSSFRFSNACAYLMTLWIQSRMNFKYYAVFLEIMREAPVLPSITIVPFFIYVLLSQYSDATLLLIKHVPGC